MGTMAEMLSTPLGVIEWFVYLLAAVMFVIGLHLMNSPKTARKGNMVSAVGMPWSWRSLCCSQVRSPTDSSMALPLCC